MRWSAAAFALLVPGHALADGQPSERTIFARVDARDPGSTRQVRYVAPEDRDGVASAGEVFVGPPSGTPTQRLRAPCDAGAGICLASVALLNVNFDGFADLVVLREHGAKSATYNVWIFDPRSLQFERTPLASRLSKLINLTVDARARRLVSFTIGPARPSQSSYEVRSNRLVLVEECAFENVGTEPEGRLVVRGRVDDVMQTIEQSKLVWDAGDTSKPMPCVTVP